MKKLTLFLFILISFLCKTNNLYAQNWSLERSVQMYAEINESPPSITLHWESQPVYGFTLYRRLKGASSWGSPLAELNGDVNTYIDNDVSIGISYEYKIVKDAAISGFGSINAGIKLPMVDYRGGLILLVDQTHADELSFELERLRTDLEGDGWVVARIDLSPDDEVTAVKQAIVSKINFDTIAYNAIFLLGHIPVPYSGNLFPDGHTNHEGAWPADLYYGELNSNWTDISVNNSISLDDRNHNIPADGKFDQSVIPSDIELPVGRVDFANMPAFTETETELLRKYLDKHHAFRHKHFTSTRRMLTENNFGGLPEGFAQSAYRNGAAMFGPDEVYTIDYDSLKTGSYLWSFGAGGGTFTSANGITTTEQLAQDSLQTVFAMMFGSYFGDWDADNNLLRATLASGTVLSNVWAGRPKYQFEHMALGENIGYGLLLTQNTPTNFFVDTCYGGRLVHIALMGDPTLRMHIMEPVASVNATDDHTGNVLISWEASGDAELGYHIYKREPFSAVYSRLTQEPTTDLTYVDECVAPDRTYTYMVRALRLEHSASGSYYNLSQGITDTAYVALSCMSAVEEPERATIEVSPVPADEWLRVAVQFPQEGLAYQIQLTDTKGQLLKELSGKGNGTIHLDITSLASGLYWLRLRDELGKEYTRSVVVSK